MKVDHMFAQRETKFAPVNLDKVRLDGSFAGYASLFDKVDQGNDAVATGAFRASLKGREASSIRMLFQHNPDEPIGVWKKVIEDEKGLYVEGSITKGIRRGVEILELMRAGAIDGLSIGFKTKRARVDPVSKVRWILSADLWEISVVTFPLLEDARISAVKSADHGSPVPTIREFERWLTRDAGLSRRDARLVIANGYSALTAKRDAACETPNSLAGLIRKASQQFSARS